MAREGIAPGIKPAIRKEWEPAKSRSSSAGYILIFALWGIVIFELLCLTLSKGARFAIIYQDAETRWTETLYVVRGACLYALNKVPKASEWEMEESEPSQVDKTLSVWKPLKVEVGGIDCEAIFEDEGGKINLNAINEGNRDLLRNLLLGTGIAPSEADTIVDSVLDWLDGDDFTHANGAESDYYRNLPEPYMAKNGPFDSVEEFALIKGVTPSLYDKVRKELTVYGSAEINVNSASEKVLSSVPGISPEIAEAIVSLREERGGIKSLDELKDLFFHFGILGGKFETIRYYLTVEYSPYTTLRVASLDKKGGQCEYRVVVVEKEIIAAYID